MLLFWCRKGGYWWTAGARKGRTGARVGLWKGKSGRRSCRGRFLPIHTFTWLGRRQAPIFPCFGTAFGQSGSNQNPFPIRSGSCRAPMLNSFGCFWHRFWTCLEAAKITLRLAKCCAKKCQIGAHCDPRRPPRARRLDTANSISKDLTRYRLWPVGALQVDSAMH